MISAKSQKLRYFITDVVTSYIGFILFNIARFFIIRPFVSDLERSSLTGYLLSSKIFTEEMTIPWMMLGVYWMSGFYSKPFERSRIQEFFVTFFSSLFITLILFFALLTNDQMKDVGVNLQLLSSLFGCVWIPVFIGRYIVTSQTFRHIRSFDWRFNTIIIGNSQAARKCENDFRKSKKMWGVQVVGFVPIEGETDGNPTDIPVYSFDQLPDICKEKNVTQCIIVPQVYSERKILALLPSLFPLELPIKIAADTFSIITSSIRMGDIFAEPFVDISAPTLSPGGCNIKRSIDVLFSLFALTLLSLPMLFVALCIKIDSRGPVFYRQERLGFRKKPFYIYKFRTMRTDAEKDVPMLSSKEDPRVTKLGAILRKYRIDELPQFWNVLKGDMSIVGPRPERKYFADKILKKAPYYTLIHQVKPGITSWGMVKFGYASSVDQMVERARYDLIYLSNMSLLVDSKILIYTIKTVLTGRGM